MYLCLGACEQAGLPVFVLDRPNPLNGLTIEGPVLNPDYRSFVGLHPLPVRHGLTIGELAGRLRGGFPESRPHRSAHEELEARNVV